MPIQFDNDNPIIHDQPIADRSQGMEAIAKTLGNVSHELVEKAGDIGEQQSNAMYASSQAHMDSLKTQTKIQMIQHPGQAQQIAQSAAKAYGQILDEAVLNSKDRSKLKLSSVSDYNDIALDAARTQAGVMKRGAAVSFFTQFPQMLSNIKESVGNEKEFNNRLDSANQLISSMIINEAITPKQGEMAFKALHHTVDASKAYLMAAGNKDMSARQYHQIKGGLIGVDDGTHMNQPVDQNTAHIYEAHNNDITIETLKSDIADGKPGNPSAWFELSDKQLNHITHISLGSKSVDADIKAGTPISMLQQDLKTLNAKGSLSSYEEGRVARIKSILSDKGINSFNTLMSENPLFRQAEYDYNQTVAAVSNNPNLSKDQQHELIQKYDNDLTWKKVNLAEAMQVPDNLVQPLAPSFIEPTKQAWNLDADPKQLIVKTDYVQQGLKDYVARAQTTPLQRETTRIVANIKDKNISVSNWLFGHEERITDQDRMNAILANQTNRNYGDLKLGISGNSDEALRNQVQKSMAPSIGFVSTQRDGQSRASSMVTMATNLVKFYAQQAGDLELNDKNKYVAKAAAIVNAAYPVSTGVNWRISKNDIPIEGQQMDKLSSYLINEARLGLVEHFGVHATDTMLSQNPLSVISTPTGHLVVIDSYGAQVSKERYRGSLLHYADHKMDQMEKNKEIIGHKRVIEEGEPSQDEEVAQDEKRFEEAKRKGRAGNRHMKKLIEEDRAGRT